MDDGIRKEARELIIQIRRVRVAYTGFLTKGLDKLGLNIPQYTALAILEEKGETTMGVLAEALGITMGAVTNLVDRLIDSGFATRERGTEDRRIVNVRLTEEGRKVLEKALEIGTGFLARYLVQMTPQERQSFVSVYRKAADLITSAPVASA